MDLVSVVIPNWNGAHLVKECLLSLSAQTYSPIEIILVDNGSTDHSLRIVKENFPEVIVLANQTNLGFSVAANQGIERSKGRFILLLNTDVTLDRHFVSEMVKLISRSSDIGSVTGRLLKSSNGRSELIDSTGHLFFRNRLAADRGEGEEDKGQYNLVEEVFGACAAASLYRREMLEDVKVNGEYFDRSFFAFLEDVDLNWRAQLRGWRCLYAPTAVGHHHRGGTAIRRSRLVEEHNYKNRYLMILKNDDILSLVKNAHHFLLTDTLKTLGLLFRCPTALLGWLLVIKALPVTLKKRRIIQQNRKRSQAEVERWFQPFDYGAWIKKHLWSAR